MAGLRRNFQIVRVKIAAIDNNNIFEPASNKKLALVEKSQITCPQKWTFAGTNAVSPESIECFFRTFPITGRNAWTRYPYFADAFFRTQATGFRIDNYHLVVRSSLATSYDRLGFFGVGLYQNGGTLFQGLPVQMQDCPVGECFAASYEQRGLGQSIARIKSLAVEATGSKGF